MGRIDEACVGEFEKFGVEGVEEHAAERGGGPAEAPAEVGPADVADEKRVAGQDGVGLAIGDVQVIDDNGDGFGGMAGGFEYLQFDAAKVQRLRHREMG